MPTKKHKDKKTAIPIDALPERARQHLSDLAMPTIEAYFDWCRAQGFACTYRKTRIQCDIEHAHARRLDSEACVRDSRSARRPTKLLRRLLDGDLSDRLPPSMLALGVRLDSMPKTQRALAKAVLEHVSRQCPDLLFERMGSGASDGMFIQAVIRMCEFPDWVVREVHSWRPRSHNARRRVASLARHLFARWDVPRFFDNVWFDNVGPEGGDAPVVHRRWYLHLGAGRSIRTVGLPIPYSKKMAHHFTLAPEDYSVVEALRWGQVHGLGGDGRVVEALRGTCLMAAATIEAEDPEVREFWTSVLRFFIRHPMLDTVHYGPVLDFLYNQRFVSEEFLGVDGLVATIPPPQPGLTMRGRTPDSLLQQVERWHQRLGLAGRDGAKVTWRSCGLPTFRSVEGKKNQRIWTIRELCSKQQLQSEGRRMNHCVATYAGSCRSGRASIWAMEVESKDGVTKILTIEVRPASRRIVQARGPSNRSPPVQARAVMARWATAANLTIANWVARE